MSTEKKKSATTDFEQRLEIQKYLVGEAERLLMGFSSYSMGAATLLLYDAVEAFLQVLADHQETSALNSKTFAELLDGAGNDFTTVKKYKASIDRLNNARFGFKYTGIGITKSDALGFARNVRAFLSEVCQDVFDYDFWSTSSRNSTSHRRTENWIQKAQEFANNGQFAQSVECSAIAAAVYLNYQVQLGLGRSDTLRAVPIGGSFLVNPFVSEPDDESLEDFREWAEATINTIRGVMHLAARGVDIVSYRKFQTLTPMVRFAVWGRTVRVAHFNDRNIAVTEDDACFCVNFVVDMAKCLEETSIKTKNKEDNENYRYVLVESSSDVIVDPREKSPEVIRQAQVGERIAAWPGRKHQKWPDHVAIIQDDDVAFVSRAGVRWM